MKRIRYGIFLGLGIAIGLASFIGLIGAAQTCSAQPNYSFCCLPVQNIRIDNALGKIQFEVTRWTYIYIFGYRPGIGWEALNPVVKSQVRHYGPGCYTIMNGLIRFDTRLRFVFTDYPCANYPDRVSKAPLISEIPFGPNCGQVKVIEIKLIPPKPLSCRPSQPPQSNCCSWAYNACCLPCCNPCVLSWLLLLFLVAAP